MARDATAERPRTQRERHDLIRRRVLADGTVGIDELARNFGVSAMTIHRDLDTLQSAGWLRKIRGGASAEPSALFHGDLRHRLNALPGQKRAIARAAAPLVQPGQSVLLDESTTGLYLSELLPERGPLTVIANFEPVISGLAGNQNVDLISLGGRYYPALHAFLGMRTVEACQSLSVDHFFMSSTAVTDGAVYHLSQEVVQLKRVAMAVARNKVLLVDHDKFRQSALHRLAPVTAFDLVVVDEQIDPAELARLADLGVEVRVAPPES